VIKNSDHCSSELTFDQKNSLKAFNAWLDSSSVTDPFVLSGFAGSGKTFLASKLLKFVEEKKLSWTVVAPTHKAVGVLRKALEADSLRPSWYPSTIHRLLRLKLKRRGNLEICEETEQTKNSLENLNFVLIDEASMVDISLLEILLKCAALFKTRLVFVGDPAQLPPVGENESSVFSMKRAVNSQLNEVVRHYGPVLKLASLIREGVIPCTSPPCLPTIKTSQGIVTCCRKDIWLQEASTALKLSFENGNPDDARILCYTNRVLESLVPYARRAIHGDMASQYPVLPGEVLISRKAVTAEASIDDRHSGEDPEMLISSNREIVVLDVKPDKFNFSECGLVGLDDFAIEILIANVRCDERVFSLRLLPPIGTESRRMLDLNLKKLSLNASNSEKKEGKMLWRSYFLLRDAFASLGPASVLTVHRSQGSTFANVFIASDVFSPKNIGFRRQLAYVAISRASNGVWLVSSGKNNVENQIWEDQLN
tara:strand:- start:6427 stop:7872 length:1446 start_codon:yes stop_codon:yes gene_type:complete